MACRERRDSRILLCLGLLVVASSFCHCTRLTKLKALDKLRGNSTLSKGQAKGRDLRRGRLLIGQISLQGGELRGTTKNFLDVDTDYQADMGWGDPKQPQLQGDVFSRPNSKPDNAAVDRLLKMDPKVECTGDSMKLQVQDAASTLGSLFFVDRGSRLSPLPLSKLPPSCGYTIRSTMRDLVLVAPYNGCFVALEEDCYVLPLRWCGLPVKMSCPLMKQSSPNPPMVTCHAQGMVVKTGWTVSVAKINVNLTGNWEPLMKASPRCGFSVVVHPEGVVISVRYAPCLEKKDGMYTLQLAGEGEIKISCPSLSPAQTEHTRPTNGPKLQTETPSKELYPSTPSPINPTQAAAPRPPQPVARWGRVKQPFYPFHFYPQPVPEKPTAVPRPPQPEAPQPEPEKPTVAPRPPQTEAPWGQVQQPFYPFHFYPQPGPGKPSAAPRPPQPEAPQPEPEKPTAAPRPPQRVAPWGQVQQPFYPFHFYPQPEPEKPAAAPRPPQPEAPEPEKPAAAPRPPQPEAPEPEKPTVAPRPPQPEAPRGQVQQPFYPFYFYPQPGPEKPSAAPRPPQPEAPQPEPEKPTAAPRPPQRVAPWGQVQQPFYPFHFYPQPEPEKPAAAPRPPQPEAPEPEKPTAAPRPPQPEAPWGQVQQPFYPFHFYPQPGPEKPSAAPRPPQPEAPQPEPEKPTAATRPPQPVAPWGQVQQPFYPFDFYPQPEPEKSAAAPRPPQPEAPQPEPGKPTAAPRPPQPEVPQPEPEKPPAAPRPPQPVAPPVYCPQICPSGFSNCCPQIAFHQHLHQIIPAGFASQDAPSVNPGLPFLPSFAYSGFGNGLGSAPLPQRPTEAMMTQPTTTSTSAPISSQSLPSGNKWPPDGIPAALLYNPSKPSNPEQPTYPYFVPNSPYSNWPYLPQNEELQILPQSHASGNEPVNPVLQYEPYNVQPQKHQNIQFSAGDMNNPYGPNFVSHISQYLQQQHIAKLQSTPTVNLQPSNDKASESERQMQPEVQSELDRLVIPYYMLQDAQVQLYDNSMAPNNASQPQQFGSGPKKSTKPDQTVQSYSEPNGYVLLQHGPPGREPNSFEESPLPFRDLVHDANFFAQNLARHHSSKSPNPQNLNPPQEKPQHPKWLGRGMSYPLPDVNYMPRPGDEIRRSTNG